MLKTKLLLSFGLAFAFMFSGILSAAGQNRDDRAVITAAERVTRDRFTVAVLTPKGARVYAVRNPSAQMLSAIDRGLTDLFAVARKNRYGRRLAYTDYVIFIANPDRQKNYEGNYSPDIAVGAAQYAGGLYDKGGYIYAAGMVIGYNPCAFVIGEHTRDFNRVSEVVRFEGEHLVLYHNDRQRFNETADHSQGGGHPILR
jgi:hypothetical protein